VKRPSTEVSTVNTKLKLVGSLLLLLLVASQVQGQGAKHIVTDVFGSAPAPGSSICSYCHAEAAVNAIHYPEKIWELEKSKDQRRRLCPDCHGPVTPAVGNPNTQDSALTDVIWLENKSYFRVKGDSIHGAHIYKLNAGKMTCDACHSLKQGEPWETSNLPVVPLPTGDHILVCEECHIPNDPGSYVAIHITNAHFSCTTCHVGDLSTIHRMTR